MKKYKNSLFYAALTALFFVFLYNLMKRGAALEDGRNVVERNSSNTHWDDFLSTMSDNIHHPLAMLLIQIISIIIVARIFGWFFRRIGQPSVIGEMVAGIVLGPSLLGLYFPEFSQSLFPAESLGNLQFLSQIGLILFMFVIGMELDINALKNKANDAVVISHASIIFPFALGSTLAYFVYAEFAPEGVGFLSFALFMGIAMSITAFPVLARIVQERGIHKTKLGTIVITCAAADDITAWCILAIVIAIVKAGSFVSSLYIVALAVGYVFLMLKVVRPFLKRVAELKSDSTGVSRPIVAIFLLTLILSAYATEVIGIHALFGAFMAGAIMPEVANFRTIIIDKVEDVAVVLLLPLFFVFTGLRTQIGLINDPYLWKLTGLIIVVAVVGKFVGSALAAKFVGQNLRDSLTIGALMNTRGLMELVVLNIGYDLGVLTAEVFTMMVIMALVTTFMTGPALDLINYIFRSSDAIIPDSVKQSTKFKVLISFGQPEKGKTLLRLANGFVKNRKQHSMVTAMHLTLSHELHTFDIEEEEKRSFAQILDESAKIGQSVVPVFKASSDIENDIVEIANQGDHNLLLVGMGESIFEGTLLGKVLGYTTRIVNPDRLIDKLSGKEGLFESTPFDERTRQIVAKSRIPVGVLITKEPLGLSKVFVPIFSDEDSFLIEYGEMLAENSHSQVTFVDPHDMVANNPEMGKQIENLNQKLSGQIHILEDRTMKKDFLERQDIMLISLESWKKLVNTQSLWVRNISSVLIIKH